VSDPPKYRPHYANAILRERLIISVVVLQRRVAHNPFGGRVVVHARRMELVRRLRPITNEPRIRERSVVKLSTRRSRGAAGGGDFSGAGAGREV
jgi:hypothetical protein